MGGKLCVATKAEDIWSIEDQIKYLSLMVATLRRENLARRAEIKARLRWKNTVAARVGARNGLLRYVPADGNGEIRRLTLQSLRR